MTNEIIPWRPRANEIYHMDALTLLRTMEDESVDLIVTDPPYGIGYASSRKTRKNGEPRITKPSFGEDRLDTSWINDATRVLKPSGAMYLFTRWDVIHHWHKAIELSGAKVAQRLVWDKQHFGMGDLKYYGSQIEDILFCVKGMHHIQWEHREGNVWRFLGNIFHLPRDGVFNHPTQKPVDLIEYAIFRSSKPLEVVLDPFMGSGTTAVAARNLNRNYIGCDISREYVDIARKRLRDSDPYRRTELANGEVQLSLFEGGAA